MQFDGARYITAELNVILPLVQYFRLLHPNVCAETPQWMVLTSCAYLPAVSAIFIRQLRSNLRAGRSRAVPSPGKM